MLIVIDASLMVQLLVAEPFSAPAQRLASYWAAMGIALAAPDFMPAEVSSALLRKAQEGAITAADAKVLLERYYRMGIALYPSRQLHSRAIDLSLELRQRMPYDSHYLALAEALDCDFWTADRPFYRAARPNHPRVQWIGNA